MSQTGALLVQADLENELVLWPPSVCDGGGGGGGGGRRWREEGRGERKKGVREEESRDQSIVWDYVCSDNILHPTHCSLSGCFTAAVSDSLTQLHTHTHTKAPSLIPCTPIRIMPLAKFTPSSAATVSKCD